MKVNPGFILREIAGDYLVVAVGNDLVDLSDSFTLSESGAFLWKALEQDTTEEALVDALLSEYDVDRQTAISDVQDFLKSLSERNMLV